MTSLWSNPLKSQNCRVRHTRQGLATSATPVSCASVQPLSLLRFVACHAVRTAKFVARKQWIVCGSDDMFIRVYNYNTMDKIKQFEAHTDYIRSVAVHPTQPYLLTCSDDMLIKLWDWDKVGACKHHDHLAPGACPSHAMPAAILYPGCPMTSFQEHYRSFKFPDSILRKR